MQKDGFLLYQLKRYLKNSTTYYSQKYIAKFPFTSFFIRRNTSSFLTSTGNSFLKRFPTYKKIVTKICEDSFNQP